MKQILAGLCLVLLALPAGGTKVMAVSIAELARNSELIVYGKIELGQLISGNCGVRYVAKVEDVFKGRFKPARSVLFSSGEPLVLGSQYVLFLSKDTESFEPILSTNSFGPQPDPERVKTCKQNRPLYTVNIWGNGALKVIGTYPTGAKVAVFSESLILMPRGTKVVKLDPSARYDLDRSANSVEFRVLRDLLKSKHAPML